MYGSWLVLWVNCECGSVLTPPETNPIVLLNQRAYSGACNHTLCMNSCFLLSSCYFCRRLSLKQWPTCAALLVRRPAHLPARVHRARPQARWTVLLTRSTHNSLPTHCNYVPQPQVGLLSNAYTFTELLLPNQYSSLKYHAVLLWWARHTVVLRSWPWLSAAQEHPARQSKLFGFPVPDTFIWPVCSPPTHKAGKALDLVDHSLSVYHLWDVDGSKNFHLVVKISNWDVYRQQKTPP